MKNLTVTVMILFFTTVCIAGTGSDALSFLKIKPSARAASLGDGFVALADDANAGFYNSAGLAQINSPEVSLMHMAYISDTAYEYGAIAVPVGKNLRLGMYLIYLDYGAIAKTMETAGVYDPNLSGSFTLNDLAAAVSAGYRLGDGTSIGLTVKYAVESIDTVSISGVMADAGVMTEIEGVKLGAAVYNLGADIGADKTPVYARMGAAGYFSAMTDKDLCLAVGINYVPSGSKTSGSIGAEYTYDSFFTVRGSYTLGADSDTLNIGAGIKTDILGLTGEVAYNYSLLGDMGSLHRVGLGIKFEEEIGRKQKTSIGNDNKQRSIRRYYYRR